MQGYVKVLDLHLWAGRWGATLTLVNDWVDFRWHQLFLELMVLSLMRRRYVQAGLSLRFGAVPLFGIMYNQSLLVAGDTRGISFHLLGFSAALRIAPRHFGDVQRPASGASPAGVPFMVYDLSKMDKREVDKLDYVSVARCTVCRTTINIPTSPWPPDQKAVTAELDKHAATHIPMSGTERGT